MSEIFLNKNNNHFQIDNEFICTLEEFKQIKTDFNIDDEIIEIEYNSDENKRNFVKYEDGSIEGIEEDLMEVLIKITQNKAKYKTELENLRKPKPPTLKEKKLAELCKAYDEAQWVDVKSKIEFRVQLRGDSFVLLRQKVTDARENGKASFTVQKNGLNYTIKDIPYAEWQKFFQTVQPISEGNYNMKVEYENNIKNAKNQTELNKIKLNFPKIKTVVINV